MIFLSRYTEEGDYPKYAEILRESLVRFGLLHDVRPVRKVKDWTSFNLIKAESILEQLLHLRRPICWIDCDCEIVKLPALLLNEPHDFAVYNWQIDPESTTTDAETVNFSGGVIAFGYTAPAVELAMRWRDMCKANHVISDDKILSMIHTLHCPPTRNLWLPKSYNRMDSLWPHIDPVIDHHYTAGGHKKIGHIPAANC